MWTVQEREVLMSINAKNDLTMKELFNEIPDPIFFYAPVAASKEEFLIVIKLFNKEEY